MNSTIMWSPELMLEVKLNKEDSFLIAMETLQRMGMSTVKDGENTILQSCHILHKQGRYYIMHFREMYAMDGKNPEIPEVDIARRNGVAVALEKWGICEIVDKDSRIFEDAENSNYTLDRIRIISHKDKKNWTTKTLYKMGAK